MLDIALLSEEYAVCRLAAGSAVPAGLLSADGGAGVVSITASADETSIICPTDRVPGDAAVETPWRLLQLVNPSHLALTGILASVVGPLADASVNIVAFSTYDTDYVLVPAVRLNEALAVLRDAGHRVA